MIKVNAVGRLANDAKVFSYGNEGKTGVSFGIISTNPFNPDDSTYLQCNMFGRDQKFAQYLTQGNQVIVSGDLQSNKDKEGNVWFTLVVKDLEFGAKKMSSMQQQPQQNYGYPYEQQQYANVDPYEARYGQNSDFKY